MGPKDREELEIWTRFAVASTSSQEWSCPEQVADAMLAEWRTRRDAIVAAEVGAKEQAESAEAARKEEIRAALNAAPWESDCDGFRLWTRRAMGVCDDADTGRGIFWLHGHGSESDGVWSLDWPEGFGSPPPGWPKEVEP